MGNAQKKSSGTSSGVFSPVHSRARDGGNPGNAEGKKAAHVNGAYTAEETGNTGTHGVNLDAPAGDLPPPLARLKNEGNMLFKTGQFGLALQKYTQAIEGYTQAKEKYTLSTEGHTLSTEGHTLSTEGHTLSGIDSPEDLCILYSNRAACFLKDGNCTDCIQDCTSALELRPFSLKPLLRRAMAYESLERYRNAYVDYKTVLQIDSSVQAAHDSVHRITKQLMEQDGPDWREKLPEIPNVPISAQQHRREEPSADVLHARAVRAEEEKVRKAEARFTLLKEEGNDLVKRGEFEKAMQKYSECIALKPTECSVYTNRALCLLKLDRFAEARQDCDSALQIESDNKKAFYRRALAHKGLKDFLLSSSDLQEVLRLDPNVREAEQELQEVTVLLRESLLESNTQD